MLVKRQSVHTMDMTTGPLVKKMLLFAVPLALSTLLQLLFNAADLVVGRFCGSLSVAAVGATTNIVYLLVGNPRIGIAGAPVGMLLCYLCIGVMNLIAIGKVVPKKARIWQNLLRPAIPAAMMGVLVWSSYRILVLLLGESGTGKLSFPVVFR